MMFVQPLYLWFCNKVMKECIFSSCYEANCKKNVQLSQSREKKRIEFIIKTRRVLEVMLHKKLVPLLENDSELKGKYCLYWTVKCCSTKVFLKDKLQSFTKYLRLTLIFMLNSALRKNFNFCFSKVFG